MTGKRMVSGILASLAGGIVFGIMMQVLGMMKMIAGMMGSQSDAVGWLAHLMISAIFGVTWLIFAGARGGAARGLIYGAVVWIFGPLIVMPMMAGMKMFNIDATAMMSLAGHLIYGLITGLVFTPLVRSSTPAGEARVAAKA